MKGDIHNEARELIALGSALTNPQQTWLRTHLNECEACRNYSDGASHVVRALRSVPLAADSRLVRTTQMRVRFHASRLREARERMWLIAMACVGVGFSAALTAPLLWRLFAWVGELAGLSRPVWEAGFVFFWIAPALLVSIPLLARGIHLPGGGERSRQ